MRGLIRFFAHFLFLLVFLLTNNYAHSSSDPFEIGDVKVFSVSKEKESYFESAASTFIISSDDIRRSGATSLPEALRLAPGLEVARSNSSNWSVTSRGFGRLYDNKILVLVDGREMYSSVFTGANWDITDVVLDDIDHIEVIRGSLPNLWGANTLNGVINIITKKANYTQGEHASLLYGNRQSAFEYRHGSNFGDDIFYRVYGKKTEQEDTKSIDFLRGDQNQDSGDSWGISKAGFRIDWQKSLRDDITISGDIHDGKKNLKLFIPTMEETAVYDYEYLRGINLDAKWKRAINKTDSLNLHLYFDNTARKSDLGSIKREIINFDAEYHFRVASNNKFKIGFGYRNTGDSLKEGVVDGILVNTYDPQDERSSLYTAFIQDTHSIIPNELDVIVGSRIEHHYVTGTNYMPSLRFKWTPDQENTFWTSISKGIRQPSRLELSLRRLATNLGNIKVYWQSNSDFKAEKMLSYEAGYRNRSFSRIEFDVSIFRNEYDNVRTFEPNFVDLQYELYNRATSRTLGLNTNVDISILDNWNVALGYSHIEMDILFNPDSSDTLSEYDAGVSPRHQFQIQSRLNLTSKLDFDAALYYVDALKSVNIESYYRTDLRLAYRPINGIEISLVGQKLFYGDKRETTRPFYMTHNANKGSDIYGKIKWEF